MTAGNATWNHEEPLERALSARGKLESRKSNAAFRQYAIMGAGRSLRKLLAVFQANPTAATASWPTLSNWSAEYDWVDRAKRFDEIEQRRALEAYEAPWRAKIMGQTEVLGRLSDMGRANLLPFIRISEETGAVYFDFSDPEAKNYFHLIKKVKTKRTRRITGKGDDAEAWEDEWVEVELHDAQNALVNMGRHHKLFVDQQELSGTITTKSDPENAKRQNLAISTLAQALGEILSGTSTDGDGELGTAVPPAVAGPALTSG